MRDTATTRGDTPLAGLAARVEDCGTKAHRGGGRDDRRVHVIIEGPNTAVVKTRRVGGTYNADAAARKFAATFNMLSIRPAATER